MSIGDRIKSVRKHFGITQAEFGEKIGVKGNTVTTYENGTRSPSDVAIVSICREYGVDEIWLREGIGEMFRERSTDEELSSFFGEISFENPGFKKAFLAVLARMTEEEWQLLERKAWELAKEMENAGPQ